MPAEWERQALHQGRPVGGRGAVMVFIGEGKGGELEESTPGLAGIGGPRGGWGRTELSEVS